MGYLRGDRADLPRRGGDVAWTHHTAAAARGYWNRQHHCLPGRWIPVALHAHVARPHDRRLDHAARGKIRKAERPGRLGHSVAVLGSVLRGTDTHVETTPA